MQSSRMTTSGGESEQSETENERLEEEKDDDVTFSGRARTVSFEENSMCCREESMRVVDERSEGDRETGEEKSLTSLNESSSLAHGSFTESF